MDDEWFDDDITSRVKEFVPQPSWGREEHLQEIPRIYRRKSLLIRAIAEKKANLRWRLSVAIFPPSSERSRAKMYKKRLILIWPLNPQKKKPLSARVYPDRYGDYAVENARTEYVVPLLARYPPISIARTINSM